MQTNPLFPASRHLTASAPACAIWASSFESTPPLTPFSLRKLYALQLAFPRDTLVRLVHAFNPIFKQVDPVASPRWILTPNGSAKRPRDQEVAIYTFLVPVNERIRIIDHVKQEGYHVIDVIPESG